MSEEYEMAAALSLAAYLSQEEPGPENAGPRPTASTWQVAARLHAIGKPSLMVRAVRACASAWSMSGRWLGLWAAIAISMANNSFASAEGEIEQYQIGAKRPLKVLLAESACHEIYFADACEIFDEATGSLLAALPPQSSFRITISEFPGTNRSALALHGKIENVAARRVLLAKGPSTYEAASFISPLKDPKLLQKGFNGQPLVIEELKPEFLLPLVFNSSEQAKSVGPGYLFRPTVEDGVFSINAKTYRGELLLRPKAKEAKTLMAVNRVDLEDYLLSVVPSEMPASWAPEAVKAQAIAARSYALANLNKHKDEDYDVKATTEDQVYLGIQTEHELANRAVAETNGLVLSHGGKVISAFFHSTSGGITELTEHVWKNASTYLQSVPDFDDQSPHFSWQKSVPVSAIEESLRKSGKDVGAVLFLSPLTRSPSQRVKSVLVAGTLQALVVSGEELRRIFTLPSTLFNLGPVENGYLAAGRGYGHGLGMSQWGAKSLAEHGYNAAQILSYYYKDVSIEVLSGEAQR